MAEGFLGGLSGFGDFLTGGGVYADPKAINPTYGVPEGDVRQAAINQLSQLSALALAAGQPMEGAQRAQLLAQMGQTGSQFNTNLYNAAQRRLMTAQMQEKQDEMSKVNAMAQKVKDDPEGLAKSLGRGFTPELIKTIPARSLVRIAEERLIKSGATEPAQEFLNLANQRLAQTQQAGGQAVPSAVSQTATQKGVSQDGRPSQFEIFLQTLPEQTRNTVRQYENAISLATDAGRPDLVKIYADQLNAAVPELKTFKTNIAETEAKKIASAPDAYVTSVGLIKILDEAIAHPGRESATGKSWLASYIPGSDAAGFVQRVEQIKGKTFQEQVKSLVGMGALSNAEGLKITAAAGRLEKLNVSEEEYLTALKDLRNDTYLAVQRSMKNLGGRPVEGYPMPAENPYAARPQQAPAQSRITTQPQGSITGRARIIAVE